MKAHDQSATKTIELPRIKVVWNSTIYGKFTAFAEEDKAGYNKGDIVATLDKDLSKMPNEISVIPKLSSHAI